MYLHVILHFPLNVAIVVILEILDFYANQCALAPAMAAFQVIQMLVHVHLQVQHATVQTWVLLTESVYRYVQLHSLILQVMLMYLLAAQHQVSHVVAVFLVARGHNVRLDALVQHLVHTALGLLSAHARLARSHATVLEKVRHSFNVVLLDF
jgi:hypothetical protein